MKNIIIILTITIPLVALFFYIDSKQPKDIEIQEENEKSQTQENKNTTLQTKEDDDEQEPKTQIIHNEINEPELKQIAWIPPWDYTNGVNSLKNFQSKFTGISPVTFQINADGSLTQRLDPNLNDLKIVRQQKNTKILPTISNFDSNMMRGIFENEENFERHISSILEVVNKYEYDGIDLDYESIQPDNKDKFLELIKRLSVELRKENKILSITVLPKWGEDVVYTALAGTRRAQDWEEIGKWADEVRIMAYDFTHTTDSKAGPIAPIDWVEKVLEYAITKIPRDKIWLGIHLYSYEWVINSQEQKTATNSYTYNVVKERILKYEYVNVEYNKEYEEGYAHYPCLENQTCFLYYATPQSVQARQDLAKKYKIAGVTYWRLGGEGELIQ